MTSAGERALAEPMAMPSSPAETCGVLVCVPSCAGRGWYHVETQSSLPLRLEHEEVHDAHYQLSVDDLTRVIV